MACFDCGLDYDANGDVAVQFIPSCDAITNNGGTYGGMSCFEGPDGKKRLFVAPDAGGVAYRQTRLASFTLDGPINNAPFFNNVNSGTHIYNSRNGFVYASTDLTEIVPFFSRGNNQGSIIRHNFSCGRKWDYSVVNTFNASILCSANFKANFVIEESFDGATWTTRDNIMIDNLGEIAKEDKLIFVDTTWNGGVLPLTTEYTDFRVRVDIISGSVTLINPDFSAVYWAGGTIR